jgi:acetyltransferase-like isoleucine patch superfamily enzyme
MGGRSILFRPMLVKGAKFVTLGSRTVIREFCRLEVIERPEKSWKPSVTIGSGVTIEQGVHLVCQGEMIIEDDVAVTAYCAIVDTYHPHDPPDMDVRIGSRLPSEHTFVRICRGAFIGVHSVILPNVRIGRGTVVGAGSVVTHDIPDYCVAVGSPARVIARFDPEKRTWTRIKP